MKVLGIIPARGGSKGIPGKNYKSLIGKPLIEYTINTAKNSNLSELIVSTDDEHILNISRKLDVKTPFIRPDNLSSDKAKSIDVAVHALLSMERINNIEYEAIMLLQPTTPFRRVEDINNAIGLLINNNDSDSVISVVNVEGNHPARMKYIKDGVLIDPDFCEEYENQNRQELNQMYIRNGAIYLTKREVLLSNSFKGNKCLALKMPRVNSINIDSALDFTFAEYLINKKIV
jgi:CMP-N-acetylneuraminic acid synthetase